MFPSSMLSVFGSMSTNVGCASTHSAQLALATNDRGDVATVSPFPTPAAHNAACNATVPVANATAYAAPVTEHSAASKRSTAGPCVSQSLRSTSTTAAMSVVVDRLAAVRDLDLGHDGCRCYAASTERRSSIESHSSLVLLAYTKSSSHALPTALGPISSHHGCSGITRYTSPASIVWRASSEVIRSSWSFSPGRMPMTSYGAPGAMASREIDDPHRRDLRDEDLAAFHRARARGAPDRRPGAA